MAIDVIDVILMQVSVIYINFSTPKIYCPFNICLSIHTYSFVSWIISTFESMETSIQKNLAAKNNQE
jgi:hypothetical protein